MCGLARVKPIVHVSLGNSGIFVRTRIFSAAVQVIIHKQSI